MDEQSRECHVSHRSRLVLAVRKLLQALQPPGLVLAHAQHADAQMVAALDHVVDHLRQ